MQANAICPRCGETSLEVFKTHSYCACCNYDSVTTAEPKNETNNWSELIREIESLMKCQEKRRKDQSYYMAFEEAA